ncbi:CFAP69 [Bugula neritina]|uniref:CFAP69 n=1 Tax=Bugula neritina TaxID=10212 RepID=A0A7J7J978_BUGNE|nr:CFAP69 [Bugula neritina]
MATVTSTARSLRNAGVVQLQNELQPYPVIDTVVTDEVVGSLKGHKFEPISLAKVEKLLTDPHSACLYDRHLHALNKVIKHYKNAFLLKDLVQVFKILNTCADRIDENEVYLEPLLDILKIVGKPFFKEKSSDETSYEQIAIQSISQLGYLMRCNEEAVQLQICATILSIYANTSPGNEVQKLCPCSYQFSRMIVENSDVSETLVKSLALIDGNLTVKLEVLHVLQELSKYSELTCAQMLAANAGSRVCQKMLDPDTTGLLLFRSTEILWNLLENGVHEELSRQLNDITCVSVLRDAFMQTLTTGFSTYDRQIRNDLLVLMTLVLAASSKSPFLETGLIKQLSLLATFQEIKTHNPFLKHFRIQTNPEDFEFKKLLINLVVVVSKQPINLHILSENRLLLALFHYVKSNTTNTGPQQWSPAQFEEIQLHAMSALCTLSPILIQDYMSCQGNTRLLLLLEWCVSSDDYAGHGNSFHGSGGRGNKRAQMRYCIRIIRAVVSTKDEAVLQDLVDQGTINQIMGILVSAANSSDVDDAIDIEMQSDMLIILSSLCEMDIHRKELFGSEGHGIDIVTHYLKMNPVKFTSGLGHHRLILATVDAVWCCVVGCYLTEDAFLAKEGVFLLLDLLENSPKSMHNLILGCLLDLCENSKTVPHIRVWRGKNDQSAAHLLCDIWRKEEHDLGVRRTDDGSLANTEKPLMGELQESQELQSMPASSPSQAIVDVVENMRAKIHALFCKIGYTELSGMSTEDYVTLTIIEQYLNLKMGEVWLEMMGELEIEQIRPVSPDQEALETMTRAITEDSKSVFLIQHDLLKAQNDQDLTDEKEFYAEIRENYKQKEKAINDWTEYVTRTSNHNVLKAAREKQEQSVEASRINVKHKPGTVLHKYEQPALNTTAYSGRNVLIESTPLHLTGGKLKDYDAKTGTVKFKETIIYE